MFPTFQGSDIWQLGFRAEAMWVRRLSSSAQDETPQGPMADKESLMINIRSGIFGDGLEIKRDYLMHLTMKMITERFLK